jgi:hypothetical protein
VQHEGAATAPVPASGVRFASWLLEHVSRRGDSIKVQGRRRGRTLTLRVDGSVPVDVIADFIADVLADRDDA